MELFTAIAMIAFPASLHADEAPASTIVDTFLIDVRMPSLPSLAAIEPEPPAPKQPFAKGTWTLQVYGSGTHGFNDGDIYLLHAGLGYHILDTLSVNFEFIGGYTSEDEDAVDPGRTLGFDLLLRMHLLQGDGWSVYIDGGCGMIWFDDRFPGGGTRQNFNPQFGVGFTVRTIGEARLMAGLRWQHISNASKSGEDRNPGYDGLMPYAGLVIPF